MKKFYLVDFVLRKKSRMLQMILNFVLTLGLIKMKPKVSKKHMEMIQLYSKLKLLIPKMMEQKV